MLVAMITAIAHSNIALVKYWGKRDARLNLPAAGSLSLTLGDLTTTTRIAESEQDIVLLGDAPADAAFARRVTAFLDLVAAELGTGRPRFRVETTNDFPTAAGLASSASGFAALTVAACAALRQDVGPQRLSELARRGSGSAARSIPGGWVEMAAGSDPEGHDAFATEIAPEGHWDLRCFVLVTVAGSKATSSTDGMTRTTATSPYYPAWVDSVADDLTQAREAVRQRDFEQLATVAERSCLRMHASALAADPGVLYWNGATVELIHRIRALRRGGQPVFFTIDAGPHVKVFGPAESLAAVRDAASGLVVDLITSAPGGPARLVAR